MHMFHSASLKLGLERAVLSQNREQNDEAEDKTSNKKKDKEAQAKEIDELLKKGAYDVFRDEDDEEAEKFMETDIDQLLAHSSKKVTYGASATSSLGGGLGSFSKASFVANTDDGAKDVDLDDPDFWSKAVGLDVPIETTDDGAMLDAGVKRNRKQVQVYDPYAETAEAEMRKKEKLAQEKLLEKEEKERQRLEKKAKKEEAKEKKKKEREEHQKLKEQAAKQTAGAKVLKEDIPKKAQTEVKQVKKSRKSDRQLALRRVENENPALEQLKQAWEVSHRNRASAALLRFGFRFCKVRHESGLMSLVSFRTSVFVISWWPDI